MNVAKIEKKHGVDMFIQAKFSIFRFSKKTSCMLNDKSDVFPLSRSNKNVVSNCKRRDRVPKIVR